MVEYYFVGGYVRDKLLGVKNKDVDFAVEADSYEEMRHDLIYNKGVTIFQDRPEFLSLRCRHPEYGPADFTVCRTDGFYSDARHPDIVHIGSIYDDLSRRDFTVNAIAMTEDGIFLDPHNGRSDLDKNMLRTVGKAEDRFGEDALRLLRAIRFHIVRGFRLHEDIQNSFENEILLSKLEVLPAERIYEELKKCYEWDTFRTIRFFRNFRRFEDTIFNITDVGLTPFIRNSVGF